MNYTGRHFWGIDEEPESYVDYLKRRKERVINGTESLISLIKDSSLKKNDKIDILNELKKTIKNLSIK